MTHQGDPGETFLGISVDVDPFTLLGLPRRPLDDSEILQALGARMSAIANHPRGQTHEANEIRLAVHSAAARLLDPQLQKVLLNQAAVVRQSTLDDEIPQQDRAFPSAETGQSQSIPHPLSHDVLLVAAACGGWNSHAMRKLAMLAHARGIASSELPGVITEVLAGASAAPSVQSPAEENDEKGSQERVGSIRQPARSRNRSLGTRLIPWLTGSATLILLVLVWARLTGTQQQPPVAPDESNHASVSPEPSQTQAVQQQKKPVPIVPASMDARDAARVITDMAQKNTPLGESDLDTFRAAYRAVAANWISLEPDRRGALHNGLIELLYRNTTTPKTSLAIIHVINGTLANGIGSPDDYRSWIWSAGTLSRLSDERNYPTAIDSALISGLTNAFGTESPSGGQGFAEAASLALHVSAKSAAHSQPFDTFWTVWLQQLEAVLTPNSQAHSEAVLDAIESVLVEGPDPSQSKATYQAVDMLTSVLTLEPMGDVSVRLVGWFSDDRVSASDLSCVMRPLITRSKDKDIGNNLLPPQGMNQSERMVLRSELERVLLGKDSGTSKAVETWVDIADQQLALPPGSRPVEIVGRALLFSRLSAAANATLWGDTQSADSILGNLTDDIDRVIGSISSDQSAYLGGNSADEWALKYIDARQNIPIRQALLSDLTRGKRVLGPVAAELIVRDAFLGTPAAVRAQAREIVLLYADSPAILNAVLEYLPRIPKIKSSSELIEAVTYARLPSVENPKWSVRARQACVDELLRRISGVGEGQAVDLLVTMLQMSYEDRLSNTGSTARGPGNAVELTEYAKRLAEFWRQSASQVIEDINLLARMDELDRRHAGRKLLAKGSLDQFAVEQVMGVEAMALLVAAERPQLKQHVETITDELRVKRRTARTILDQILACEEAAVRLWKLRLRGDAS